MRSGKGWAVCGTFALWALGAVGEARAQSYGMGTGPWSAAWPKPSESALNLVRLMREDEALLSVVRQAAAKDPVKSRCFARLQPASLTGPLGSAIMVEMSAKEIDEAARFFQTDVGRKFTEFNLAQVRNGVEPPLDAFAEQFSLAEMKVLTDFAKGSGGGKVLTKKISAHRGVRAELYDYGLRCENILTGRTVSVFCNSEPVFSATQACSASYYVTQRAGEKLRRTGVKVSCKTGGPVPSNAFIAELEGQHETIGFTWRDERTLEVILPAGAKVVRKDTESDVNPAQRFVYRDRKATDAPAAACARELGFIDPAKVD